MGPIWALSTTGAISEGSQCKTTVSIVNDDAFPTNKYADEIQDTNLKHLSPCQVGPKGQYRSQCEYHGPENGGDNNSQSAYFQVVAVHAFQFKLESRFMSYSRADGFIVCPSWIQYATTWDQYAPT